MSKMAKTKPQNMYNGVRKEFEIMHIRVGHIRNRVYAPSSNVFGLSFPTQNNLGGVTREEMLKMAKNVKSPKRSPKKYAIKLKKNSNSHIFESSDSQIGWVYTLHNYSISTQPVV